MNNKENTTLKTIQQRKKLIILVATIVLVTGLALPGCISMSRISFKGDRIMNIKNSSNFKNNKFNNLTPTDVMLKNSFFPMLKEYFCGNQLREPKDPLPVIKLSADYFINNDKTGLRVTWLGHSSTIIEIEGKIILTDPVFSKKASPVSFAGPSRFHKEFPLNAKDLPAIDLVIISHDHYDHLDYKTIKQIHKKVARFVTPLGVGAYLEKWGVDPKKIKELDWWQTVVITKDLQVVATPAQHFSGRGLFDRYETLWASWVILGEKHRVFFSGDSGYFPGFAEIGKKYGPFDITMLEMAQYGKFWPYIHMRPEQALQAHLDLKGMLMMPIHWGTFNLSVHEWTEPIDLLLKEATRLKVKVATPRAGEHVLIGKHIPGERWWEQKTELVMQK